MKDTNEKNIHEGHRERLLELVCKNGIDNVSEVQAVEQFLTFIMPRGDVNPLAHRLLNNFESFSHIVDAPEPELARIKGLSVRSAKKINLLRDYFYYYTTAKMQKKFQVTCKADILDAFEDYLRFRTTENVIMLALSGSNIVTHKKRIKSHETSEVSIDILDITEFLSYSKPASFVIAHCHPFGFAKPSPSDEKAFGVPSHERNTR